MTTDNNKPHIVPYRVHLIILAFLIIMTLISVGVTHIYLGTVTVTIALLLATIKGGLVLSYFMHLKFDQKFYALMVIGVFTLIIAVIVVTFLDYLYR